MRPIRSGHPASIARRLFAPVDCSDTVSASDGRNGPSRSGHSSSTMPSHASSQPSSTSPPGPSRRHRSKWCTDADRRVVALHQREGRAGHLQRGIAGCGAQKRTGEGGLAGAELALQQDRIAGARQCGDLAASEGLGGRKARQLDQAGRGGNGHGANLPHGGVADNCALG